MSRHRLVFELNLIRTIKMKIIIVTECIICGRMQRKFESVPGFRISPTKSNIYWSLAVIECLNLTCILRIVVCIADPDPVSGSRYIHIFQTPWIRILSWKKEDLLNFSPNFLFFFTHYWFILSSWYLVIIVSRVLLTGNFVKYYRVQTVTTTKTFCVTLSVTVGS